jgi:hypothetical protein
MKRAEGTIDRSNEFDAVLELVRQKKGNISGSFKMGEKKVMGHRQ